MAVHVLAVLAYQQEGGVTSEAIAASVNTNPVVIRRLLCLLREAGIIETQKGAGLGSHLARTPCAISLAEIYRAVETAVPFPFPGSEPNEKCPVGGNIQAALETVFSSAQTTLEHELKKTSLADILQTVQRSESARR